MSNSLDIVGIYAVGYTIGSSINIFIASFQAAWPQMMFSVSDKPNSDIIYGKVLTYYVYFIGMIWIILSSFSYEIIFFMTDHKFLDSYSVIPIVSLAYAFQGAASISSAGIYVKNKTFNELLLMPISIGICLLANYYLIPYYSFIGAAYATLISFAMIFILYSIKGQKYVKLIIEWKKLFKIILLLSLFYNAQYSINFQNIWYSIIFKIVLISLLFFITLTSKSLFYNDITYSLINRIKK